MRHMEERYLRGEICEYLPNIHSVQDSKLTVAAGDVLIPIAQVSLAGPEFETSDDASTPDSHVRNGEGGSSWGMDSLAAERQEADGRSEGTTTADPQAATYDHLMPERSQSYSFPYSNPPPPPAGAPSSTRASSFDSSIQYSPQDYNSSAASSVMSQETSPHSIDKFPQNHRPSYSTYLNQPMLPPVPVTTVLWHPTLQATASSYHPPY